MNNSITKRQFLTTSLVGTAGLALPRSLYAQSGQNRPNILWITSEDNSPLLGCYGDTFATTPNLDRLASEGIVYENAFANVPVCAPTRFTILTGMNACSMGTQHMRSRYTIPPFIRPYTRYLQSAGYYCTNRSKTDYNYATDDTSHWDECSREAHYKNRRPGQPFFAVFNITVSHESSIHNQQPQTRHDPAQVPLPPYHPDTPDIRQNWAQYYDKVEDMDSQVGEILDELEKSGLAGDTIVFYYSDHGGVICRSKRFVYDSGTHVPMIVRFPDKYRHLSPEKPGSRTDRLVSFVDLSPTVLSLAGIEIPGHMQGEAFLGDRSKPEREYVYLFRGRMDERYDMMRAVRDKRFKYIRNYMPHRIYGQHLEYLWRAAATRSWEKEYSEGRCNTAQSIFWQTKPPEELYDTAADPWEINNLAGNPEYGEILQRMRKVSKRWVMEVNDAGFIPEGEMVQRCVGTTWHDYVRNGNFPLERIIETAELATMHDSTQLPELMKRLKDSESAVRFWAATGCAVLGEKALPAEDILIRMLKDTSGDCRITAAEALCSIGKSGDAVPVLMKDLTNENAMVALRAANVLDIFGEEVSSPLATFETALHNSENNYVKRVLSHAISRFRK